MNGEKTYNNGIILQGRLINHGVVKIRNVAWEDIDGPPPNLFNDGQIIYESPGGHHLADKMLRNWRRS